MKKRLKKQKTISAILAVTMVFSLFLSTSNVLATEISSKQENKLIEQNTDIKITNEINNEQLKNEEVNKEQVNEKEKSTDNHNNENNINNEDSKKEVNNKENKVEKDYKDSEKSKELKKDIPTETKTENTNKNVVDLSSKTELNLQILGTTDLHGRFMNYDYASNEKSDGGLNQIATIVKAEKNKNPNTIVIDNGDTIQGNYNHLFMNNNYKNPMVLAMNEIGYDVFSLGNHEFNYGMDNLNRIVKEANENLNILCANLYKDGKRVFKPYVIKEFQGIKVATIGVVSPYIMEWDAINLKGYNSTNPTDEVKKVIKEIKDNEGADIYVVSSHVGINSEYGDGDSATEIANANPEVSAILAGHSHSKVESVKVNNAIITQPQSNGKYVSKIEIKIEKNQDGSVKVIDKNASLISTKGIDEDINLNKKLQIHHETAKKDAITPIGEIVGGDLADKDEVKGIPQSAVEDQGVTDLINEVQLYYSKKQLEDLGIETEKTYHVSGAALFSSSSNLKEGSITKADINKIYKYDNKLYTIKTTGRQLKKYMEWSSSFYNTYKPGDLTISFNEDIRLYQYDMLDGVKYDINISNESGNRIENLVFEKDNKSVEDNDVVYLTVNDYRYNSVLDAKVFDKGEHEKIYDTVNDDVSDVRDLLIEYIKTNKNGKIQKNVDNNWKITGNNWDKKQREIAVKAINEGKVKIPTSEDGRDSNVKAVTWSDVKKELKGIDIVTINDFHGALKQEGKNIGAANLVGEIKKLKQENPNTIVVAGGDLFQGSALSNLLKGEPVAKMLKEMELIYSAVGNHEFDWGKELIPEWSKQGDFKFLASNIYDKKTNKPVEWAEPYGITNIGEKLIGFIGLATPETAYKTNPENVKDLEFKDPIESTNYWANYLRKEKGVDTVIVLSHLGAVQDGDEITGESAELAKYAKGIDAVISAHTHRFISGVVNNIPIVQGGNNGRGLGKLELIFDGNKMNILPSYDELYKRQDTLVEDERMKKIYDDYNKELQPILEEVVVNVDTELSHDRWSGLSPLGQFMTKYMTEVSDVQIGITNGGGLRKPLNAGDITVGDMWEVMPFDNTLVTMKLKGSDLKRVIENGIMNDNIGWVQFYGLKVYYDKTKEFGERITSMRLLDGTKIHMDKYYTVVTNDFMYANGDNYDFNGAKNVVDTGTAIRDAIIEKLKGLKKVSFKFDDKTLVAGNDITKPEENQDESNDKEPSNGNNTNGQGEEENPSIDNGSTNTNEDKDKNLPITGTLLDTNVIIFIGFIITLSGVIIVRKKKDKKAS